jgi:hypothetical protein
MASTQRPAPGRPLSPLTADSSLSAVIAAFRDTAPGDERELRAAISHVDAELGTLPVRSVRPRHLEALLDDLRNAGLSLRREAAMVDALHALFAFAIARGLVAADPTPAPAASRRPPRPPRPAPSTPTPTPTFTMLAFGARVAFWTTWVITIAFLVLLLGLLIELG